MSPRKLDKESIYKYEYSVCTLVTNQAEYMEMVDSFIGAGFGTDQCEFIFADNTRVNEFEAFGAINRFLKEARGQYIIICHQDILLIDDRNMLQYLIQGVNQLDADWAILSNAGGVSPNYLSMKITYPGNITVVKGRPPKKVMSVDENFIVIKSAANLALSGDLSGFHLYGTDICIIADILGYSAYTIPYNLLHKSEGKAFDDFWILRKSFIKKYNLKLRSRWIQTTITNFYISSSFIGRLLCGNILVLALIKAFNSLKKKQEQ